MSVLVARDTEKNVVPVKRGKKFECRNYAADPPTTEAQQWAKQSRFGYDDMTECNKSAQVQRKQINQALHAEHADYNNAGAKQTALLAERQRILDELAKIDTDMHSVDHHLEGLSMRRVHHNAKLEQLELEMSLLVARDTANDFSKKRKQDNTTLPQTNDVFTLNKQNKGWSSIPSNSNMPNGDYKCFHVYSDEMNKMRKLEEDWELLNTCVKHAQSYGAAPTDSAQKVLHDLYAKLGPDVVKDALTKALKIIESP
jgi:hypothetical protein